ncbi:hypothetical protein BHM03_00044860 [Ensete ventricosum]|nr:hypothetical protein BHM03_00044860 [Ensete ventricosum]
MDKDRKTQTYMSITSSTLFIFLSVTAWYGRYVLVRPLPGCTADWRWRRKKSEKKREKRRENPEIQWCSPDPDPSPAGFAGGIFDDRVEKKTIRDARASRRGFVGRFLLLAWASRGEDVSSSRAGR